MVTILILAAAWVGWGVLRAARESLVGLPRRNEDMIFY